MRGSGFKNFGGLTLVCGVAVTAVLVGCMSTARPSRTVSGSAASQSAMVAAPLKVQLIDARSLAAINSIAIERPSVVTGVVAGPLSMDEAKAVIDRTARETMTLKVVSASQPGSGRVSPAMDADAILRTEILRFDQRQGSAVGGEPAVVSFRMNLESAGKRGAVWSAQYFLKQEAVSENLLRLGERMGPSGSGVGWSSAREVFEKGVRAALSDLNVQREKQFLTKEQGAGVR